MDVWVMKADPVSKGLLMNKKKEKRVVEGGGGRVHSRKRYTTEGIRGPIFGSSGINGIRSR